MISIDVELLSGRYVASRYDDRNRAEWPPEPARLFSACVAALHEHPHMEARGRPALAWLESLSPPRIVASRAAQRSTPSIFVPVNDSRVAGGWEKAFDKLEALEAELARAPDSKVATKVEKKLARARDALAKAVQKATADDGKQSKEAIGAAAALLPERRGRQPRTFPSVRPEDPVVSFVWPDAEPELHVKQGLAELMSRVVRLGHSASLVACRLGDGNLAAVRTEDTWVPDPHGETFLRVFTDGQIDRLERAFERHQATEPRVLPCAFQPYRRGARSTGTVSPPNTVFGSDWVHFRVVPGGGRARPPRLQLSRAPDLARALRGALLKHADQPVPEVLSGHDADGAPLTRPHVAFVPLADVGSRWARGVILGVAVVMPRGIDDDERRAVLRALGRFEEAGRDRQCDLWMGRAGALTVERVVDRDSRSTLQRGAWVGPARRWASVTSVALDRNPGDLRSTDPEKAAQAEAKAETIVRDSCTAIGLPEPEWVQVMRRPVFDAAPKADAFMPFPRRPGATRRVCVHVEMKFTDPVAGPVLLGAGRYFGLGLCRPVREEGTWR